MAPTPQQLPSIRPEAVPVEVTATAIAESAAIGSGTLQKQKHSQQVASALHYIGLSMLVAFAFGIVVLGGVFLYHLVTPDQPVEFGPSQFA